MFGLLFFVCFAVIFPLAFFDVRRICLPLSYSYNQVLLFFLDVLKSFLSFFVFVFAGCPLAYMPVLGLVFVGVHDCILRRNFPYRSYSIFATTLGFLLFFVPGLALLVAVVFGLTFLFFKRGHWSLIIAMISTPCLAYTLYSYVFFKFLALLCITVLGLHYWHTREIKSYRLNNNV